MGFLTVRDEWTKLLGHRFLNSQICLWLGAVQLAVCIWGIAQHIYSFLKHDKVLFCNFPNGFNWLTGIDAIIFDAGLLHVLWGIDGCVAEYLDGGFGRLIWCISHSLALLFSLPFACMHHPRPRNLWPLLIQQSAYGIGLLILSLASLPRVLPIFMEDQSAYGIGLLILSLASLPRVLPIFMEDVEAPIIPLLIYLAGTMVNLFLLYVYWHWYWHVDSIWNSVVKIPFGSRLENANNRSRRDAPRYDPEGPPPDDPQHPILLSATDLEAQQQNGPSTLPYANGHLPNGNPGKLPKIIRPPSPMESNSSAESQMLPAIWPPPPVVATRLHSDSPENRRIVRKEMGIRLGNTRFENRRSHLYGTNEEDIRNANPSFSRPLLDTCGNPRDNSARYSNHSQYRTPGPETTRYCNELPPGIELDSMGNYRPIDYGVPTPTAPLRLGDNGAVATRWNDDRDSSPEFNSRVVRHCAQVNPHRTPPSPTPLGNSCGTSSYRTPPERRYKKRDARRRRNPPFRIPNSEL